MVSTVQQKWNECFDQWTQKHVYDVASAYVAKHSDVTAAQLEDHIQNFLIHKAAPKFFSYFVRQCQAAGIRINEAKIRAEAGQQRIMKMAQAALDYAFRQHNKRSE